MQTVSEIANKYFVLSNRHDYSAIAALFTEDTVYISANTGEYKGSENIMNMMIPFHESFSKLHWEVHSVEEKSPNSAIVEFTISGTKKSGETISVSGMETIIVANGKIREINIQNKHD